MSNKMMTMKRGVGMIDYYSKLPDLFVVAVMETKVRRTEISGNRSEGMRTARKLSGKNYTVIPLGSPISNNRKILLCTRSTWNLMSGFNRKRTEFSEGFF
jgi:hypothetical protein